LIVSARIAVDGPVSQGGAELHLFGLSSSSAGFAVEEPGGVVLSLVVDVTTSLLVVLVVTSRSVGTFPPDGVVVGNTGDPNVAPLIYGYTTVGKRVPAVND